MPPSNYLVLIDSFSSILGWVAGADTCFGRQACPVKTTVLCVVNTQNARARPPSAARDVALFSFDDECAACRMDG